MYRRLGHRGPGGTLKINCGGGAYAGYAADPPVIDDRPRSAPTGDFYRDWAWHEFGPEVAEAAAGIFGALDGNVPRPTDWTNGPGGLQPDPRPWEEVQAAYRFVEQLEELRPQVRGTGQQARFDYWLASFRYVRTIAQVNCIQARYNVARDSVVGLDDPTERQLRARDELLPIRRELVAQVAAVYSNLLATVSSPGELGTVVNWESHLLPGLLTQPGTELAALLGENLPYDARPPTRYQGPVRVIVPTVRTCYAAGETIHLRVLVLSEAPPVKTVLQWRRLGTGAFATVPLLPVARGVYTVEFPPEATAGPDLEYFVEVQAGGQPAVCFPATAPALNQTMVRL